LFEPTTVEAPAITGAAVARSVSAVTAADESMSDFFIIKYLPFVFFIFD
jgi:hypothetical protein